MITVLLQRWADGDLEVVDQLMEMTYADLEQLARSYLRRERSDHTLETAALINEAYLRIGQRSKLSWESRIQFFAFASQTMRRVLVDHARARLSAKRGGAQMTISLDSAGDQPVRLAVGLAELLTLDDALELLEKIEPDLCRIVVMKYFAGLNIEEIASVLGVSKATIKRRWSLARKWLAREIAGAGEESNGGR